MQYTSNDIYRWLEDAIQYTGTLIAVRDMDVSRRFHGEVLGLDAVADFGASVTLAGGLVLQTLETWERYIGTDAVTLRSNAGELYFETEDIEGFCRRLEGCHELAEARGTAAQNASAKNASISRRAAAQEPWAAPPLPPPLPLRAVFKRFTSGAMSAPSARMRA